MQTMKKSTPEKEFPNDAHINHLLGIIQGLKTTLSVTEAELNFVVERFQEKCGEAGHDFELIMEFDQNYRTAHGIYGMNVLLGKKCKKCKIVVTRPSGLPHQICHKCWGEMKHEGNIPGQGSRLHIYVCKRCGHKYVNT